jgi:hypothetical protein
MTILPPRTIKEWVISDPIGSLAIVVIMVILIVNIINFVTAYPTMVVTIDLAHICIGGGC